MKGEGERGDDMENILSDIMIAKQPGICYQCGTRIYVGDKIRVKLVKGGQTQVAEHAEHSLGNLQRMS
jgi:hypothetical protein